MTLDKAFDWLDNLFLSDAYVGVLGIYKLLPPDVWKLYKLHELEGMREQELLDEACKKLLKSWRTKRPTLFGKDKKDE